MLVGIWYRNAVLVDIKPTLQGIFVGQGLSLPMLVGIWYRCAVLVDIKPTLQGIHVGQDLFLYALA
ncbi:hypothetical protein C2869_03570 [Saccharobesus litoralis]|uniref:Uncharacterized protein n=1 Tax=Saccharobesus litoralis TaxID=2172099 RepID=A0A2S0VNB2_9ALTE|nr:hypothetical protein C2869_03570 [Saccharobesus litoralis]